MYKYDFNTDIFLNHMRGDLRNIYVDQPEYFRQTRIFVSADVCSTWDAYQTQATIAKSGYYLKDDGSGNLVSRVSECLPLAKAPLYLLEWIDSLSIWRTWLNATIEDEQLYNRVKFEAAAQLKKQKAHTDKWGGNTLLQYKPGTAATTKYCSLDIRKELLEEEREGNPAEVQDLLDRWTARELK